LLTRLQESARWYCFAMSADDRRRARYSAAIARLRRRTVARRRKALHSLDEVKSPTIDARMGFASVAAGALEHVDDVVVESRTLASPYLEMTAPWDGRQQMLSGLVQNSSLSLGSPFLRFALQDTVIATVSRYLGMVPLLAGVDVLVSRFFEERLSESQLYHCDFEDVRQVKIFLHCSDVSMDDGPLTVIPADQSRSVKRELRYKYGRAGYRISDEAMMNARGTVDEISLTGGAGTAHFVDTSTCFHYGSRLSPGGGRRIVAQYQFLTPAAFALMFRYSKLPFASMGQSHELTEIQRLVIGAE